jgi:hypothetical protein
MGDGKFREHEIAAFLDENANFRSIFRVWRHWPGHIAGQVLLRKTCQSIISHYA